MVEVCFVDGDKETFETKAKIYEESWKWIPDQQAYLLKTIEGDLVIPAAFVKYLKHVEADLEV